MTSQIPGTVVLNSKELKTAIMAVVELGQTFAHGLEEPSKYGFDKEAIKLLNKRMVDIIDFMEAYNKLSDGARKHDKAQINCLVPTDHDISMMLSGVAYDCYGVNPSPEVCYMLEERLKKVINTNYPQFKYELKIVRADNQTNSLCPIKIDLKRLG